jgi:hypothetical protein
MSKGEKNVCRLYATVGGLSRIVQPFRVSINENGGDFWHVYRKSVLFIDGKNNSEPNLESVEEKKAHKRWQFLDKVKEIDSQEEKR